jgi:hypothetical protein
MTLQVEQSSYEISMHQTKLPMARMFTVYMQFLLQIYDLTVVNVVFKTSWNDFGTMNIIGSKYSV